MAGCMYKGMYGLMDVWWCCRLVPWEADSEMKVSMWQFIGTALRISTCGGEGDGRDAGWGPPRSWAAVQTQQ